ncbi:ABC-F family ATP-binding cassette domain-containing protein [Aestuariimicrobium ganziense]|uniref:ABC-F family ATP-binding cassette domain-containing protein n=1 Tax=Aestuariimicrobium ganziense TaxID=2773677 RepID=UPI001944FE98|nr:ABC-F family ATP-binding cassette domain-containing protein [Aestuariimicrobium ganziense]
MAGVNLVNAEKISKTYGTRTLLDEVSLGLSAGDVIGVVGRNGDGKTTLLGLLTGSVEPDSGRVTRTGSISIGVLTQAEQVVEGRTVRDLIVDGAPDHVWAADSYRRDVVEELLDQIDLDAELSRLSGGERRRAGLVALLLGHHDLLVLDEPTNHLDVEAVGWLATHLVTLQQRGTAMLVVSHDRWFLDAICTRIWEVHDGVVDPYDGGYAAYVLARAERARQAAATESRRRNLLRKELAWLRRGAPARTSKPKFRIDAANVLIEDEPAPRDRLQLEQFSLTRQGKDVIDVDRVDVDLPSLDGEPGRTLLKNLTWSIGPGQRIGIVGVNGSGKTTLLRVLAKELEPTRGRVKHGKTVRLAHLSQNVAGTEPSGVVPPLDDRDRVLESANRVRQVAVAAGGREISSSQLLEDFGFSQGRLHTPVADLSGGERRRLQFLRLLLAEPNLLMLDEPTNDLDIDTLTVIEDQLDRWAGTLLVVSHDRYFLERVCDVTYALMGDGRCVLLPGGVEQYLDARRARQVGPRQSERVGQDEAPAPSEAPVNAAAARQAKKDLARLESQIAKLGARREKLHAQMAENASDYAKLSQLQDEDAAIGAELDALETQWLEAAEAAG